MRVRQLTVGLPDGARYLRGDISSGGAGLEVDEVVRVEVGDVISVRLPVPDAPEALEFSAVVVYVRFRSRDGAICIGASFEDVDAMVQSPLDRFVYEAHVREQSRALATSATSAPTPEARG